MLDYMESSGQTTLPEDQAQRIFTQLAVGVKDIHLKKIVHRDLKHKNIFIRSKT